MLGVAQVERSSMIELRMRHVQTGGAEMGQRGRPSQS